MFDLKKELAAEKRELAQASRRVFKSLPDDVVLSMATRDFDMNDANSCVCGWAFREGLDKLKDAGFGHLSEELEKKRDSWTGGLLDTDEGCHELYNTAEYADWENVYSSVTEDELLPVVELEFVRRVEEAVANG